MRDELNYTCVTCGRVARTSIRLEGGKVRCVDCNEARVASCAPITNDTNGITLSQKDRRGLYAAIAMQGILANPSRSIYQKTIIDCAVEYADALIKALEE